MYKVVLFVSWLLGKTYGYEGLNLLFRIIPMTMIPKILKHHGASIGKNVRIKGPVMFNDAEHSQGYFYNLTIGSNTFIGRNCLVDLRDKVKIGENVTLSHNVSILTHTDAGNSPLAESVLLSSHAPVIIENGVYIGVGATLLQGVQLGASTIIGACSLVNKDIPSNNTAFGIPAKIVKSRQ